MYPWLLEEWFGQTIDTYLTLCGLALLVGAVYGLVFYKKAGLSLSSLIYLVIYAVVFGVLGSRLFSFLFRLPEVFSGEKTAEELLLSGFMYYGGFIGGALGLLFFSRNEGRNFFKLADFVVLILPLGHAIGRIACYCAGCCYGVPSETHGVIFPSHITHKFETANVAVLPIMLYEAAFNVLLFLALASVYYFIYRKKEKSAGLIAGIYCVAYPIFRFIIEFWRYDDRGALLGLSTSQFISVLVLLGGLYILLRYFFISKGGKNGLSIKLKKFFLVNIGESGKKTRPVKGKND